MKALAGDSCAVYTKALLAIDARRVHIQFWGNEPLSTSGHCLERDENLRIKFGNIIALTRVIVNISIYKYVSHLNDNWCPTVLSLSHTHNNRLSVGIFKSTTVSCAHACLLHYPLRPPVLNLQCAFRCVHSLKRPSLHVRTPNRPENNGPVGFRYEHNRPSNNGGVA